MWRDEVVREALTWEGTRYIPNAHIKGVGVDCGWFLREVYNPHFGPFPVMPDYTADWALHADASLYLNFILPLCDEVKVAQPGDFTLIHLGKHYSHAAILLPNKRYIHAWGRLREGRVTQSSVRIIEALARQNSKFPLRHFTPRT